MIPSAHRRPGRPKGLLLSQDFGVACREALSSLSTISFPATQYQTDILGFARDILGYTPCFTLEELVRIRDQEEATNVPVHERQKCLWDKQVEILLAIQAAINNEPGIPKSVAVSSGHKISKSHTAAVVALWFYSSFQDAKVVMTSTTFHQVQTILWEEFRKTRERSKVHIPGDCHLMASSGFLSEDFRGVRGFTAKEPEAVAGISGHNLLFIIDEASGVPDSIHEAVQGNMAGGAWRLMFSNPTRTDGTFFDAFNSKEEFFTPIQVSSETTPNARTGRRLIPGLATAEYVKSIEDEHGKDSAFYKIRIEGKFVLADDKKPFNLDLLQRCEAAWFDAKPEGRLQIGIDPAGPGDGGDEVGWAVRRGNKCLRVYAKLGMTEDEIVSHAAELVRSLRTDREVNEDNMPVLIVDREGPIGYKVWIKLKAHFEQAIFPVRVLGIQASNKAQRRPDLYHLLRDELWGNLEFWLKNGGTIPQEGKLEKELHTIEWSQNLQGRLKATSKDDIRKVINRSPDRADALALAVWEPSGRLDDSDKPKTDEEPESVEQRKGVFDPFVESDTIDPYGLKLAA